MNEINEDTNVDISDIDSETIQEIQNKLINLCSEEIKTGQKRDTEIIKTISDDIIKAIKDED